MTKSAIVTVVLVVAIVAAFRLFPNISNPTAPDEITSGSVIQIDLAGVDPVELLSSFKVDTSSIKKGKRGTITWLKSGSLLEKKGVKKGDVISKIGNGSGLLEIRRF